MQGIWKLCTILSHFFFGKFKLLKHLKKKGHVKKTTHEDVGLNPISAPPDCMALRKLLPFLNMFPLLYIRRIISFSRLPEEPEEVI